MRAILFFLCFINITAFAENPEASLEVNSAPFGFFNRQSACSDTDIKIILPQLDTIYSNFKAKIEPADKKDPKKDTCPKQIGKSEGFAFAKDKLVRKQTDFFDPTHQACQKSGDQGAKFLCIYETDTSDRKLVAKTYFTFDTRVAQITGFSDVVSANGKISFRVLTEGPVVENMEVCYGTGPSKDDECPNTWTKFTQKLKDGVKLTDLDRHTAWTVKVSLVDSGDGEKWVAYNKGTLTPATIATPLGIYDGEGGELMYSCQAAPHKGDFLLLLCVLVCLFLARHKAKKQSFLLVLPILFFMLPADKSHAELGDLSFSILGSMYRPDLDSEATKSGFEFYKCFFRRDPSDSEGPITPLVGFDLNMHIWDGFYVGLGLGYAYVPGHGLNTDKKDRPLCDSPGDYKVSLHMYQIRPQLTYAMNHFVDYFPLFPYVRGALIGQGYYFNDGEAAPKSGNVNSEGKVIGNGGFRFGWSAAVGLMLRLDFLEPSSVRSARGEGLFDHIYLMSELAYQKVDSFGKPGFNFSPKDVMGTGLPLMWTFGLSFDLL